MAWHRWHWLDGGVLPLWIVPLLVVIVRLCWLWPWLALLRLWLTPAYRSPWLPIWAIPALGLGAMFVTRAALIQTASLRVARLWVAGIGVAAILCLLWWQFARGTYPLVDGRWLGWLAQTLTGWRTGPPPPFLALMVAAGIWLRGVLDGRRPLTRDDVWSIFATGFVLLALVILAGQSAPNALPPNTAGWMVALVAAGLSALAFSSLELARITGRHPAQKPAQLRLNRYWLASVAFVIAGVLAIGLALGAIFTPGTVARALGWTSLLLKWLAALLGYVLLALAYVIFFLLTPLIEWLRSRLAESARLERLPVPDLARQLEQWRDQPVAPLSPLVAESIRWIGLAGLVAVILVIFALALRYFRTGSEEEVEETRETIFTRAMLQEQLAALWRSWWQRLQQPSRAGLSPYLSLAGEHENRAAIRACYQALLALANTLGHPRARTQTVAEFESHLATLCPEAGSALSAIGEEYVAARYGLNAPSSEQVDRMQKAWVHAQPLLAAHASDKANSTLEQNMAENSTSASR
jgi:hypothetical protein